jgi:hypothetical protein
VLCGSTIMKKLVSRGYGKGFCCCSLDPFDSANICFF